MLCSEDQSSGPTNRHGRGGLRTDSLCGPPKQSGCVLTKGCQGIPVPGLAGKQLMPALGRRPSRTPGWGAGLLSARVPGAGRSGGEHSWDPSAWLWYLLLCQFLSTCCGLLGVSSPVSLQGPECVLTQDYSSSRDAVVLPALGTPRAGLCATHSKPWAWHRLFLRWPLWMAPLRPPAALPPPCSPARRHATPPREGRPGAHRLFGAGQSGHGSVLARNRADTAAVSPAQAACCLLRTDQPWSANDWLVWCRQDRRREDRCGPENKAKQD